MHRKIISIVFGSKHASMPYILLATFLMIFAVSNIVAAFDAPTSITPYVRSNPAAFQSGGTFNITSSVIAGGGGKSTGGTTTVEGTIGQSTLGTSSGGTFTLNGGFWQPTSSVSISGLIRYCASASNPGVPNAMVNLTGDVTSNTMTDATGSYSFTNLPGGGSFVVTPTKTGAISGIATADATRILQSLAGTLTLTACQTTAADTSTNGSLSTTDATHILNFLAGNPPAANNHTGEWRLVPTSRTYTAILGDQTSQNYDAILLGDDSGNWTPAGPVGAKPSQPAGGSITVTLPTASVGVNLTNFSLPITVDDTTGQGVTGYRLRITFDPAVVGLQATPITTTGTLSSGWFTATNTTTPGALIVTAANATPMAGAGTLLIINFTRLGAQGASTPLQFVTAGAFPGLQFEDANENIVPTIPVSGTITIGAGPTIARVNEFVASNYDAGTYLRWQTSYETQNLGFNLYREEGGKRELINQQLIAGTALRASLTTPVAAGEGYSWWDNAPSKNAAYWLEDIDLNGTSTWHGPFFARPGAGKAPARSNAPPLSRLGAGLESTSRGVETVAAASTPAAAQALQQAKLVSQVAMKIAVKREGWYRINQPDLVAGLAKDLDAKRLQLFVDGQEIPMAVFTDADGRFDENSYIEFYGIGIDTTASDARVYWLTQGTTPGKRINKVEVPGLGSSSRSFAYTIERKDRTIYFSSLRNGERENFFGAVIGTTPVDQALTVSNPAPGNAQPAVLEVTLQGVSATAHRVEVQFNNNLAGFINFNGQENRLERFNVPQALLREGANVVRLIAQNGSGDVSLTDTIRLTYQHSFKADDNKLKLRATGGELTTVSGFTNQQIRVFDITDPNAVVELGGKIEGQKQSYAISVTPKERGERILLALAAGQESQAASLKVNSESYWRTSTNAADFVILTSGNLFAAFEPLQKQREAEGLRVALVDVEDIFDEFNFGNKSPQAVKDFLAFAKQNWRVAPRFLLFGGDASYDPKNYLGFGDVDLVPTKLIDTAYMEAASDDWFSDFNNDGIADIATGRLSARNGEEAALLVAKQLRFEQSEVVNSALLVSDINDGFDFEQASAQLRSLLSPGTRVVEVKRGQLDEATAKARLFEAINQGQKIVNYTGHGSVDLWRGNLLTSSEALELTNDHLPMVVMMTCLNGYFNDPALDSLAENLLKAERGGGVAAWASSGLSQPQEQTLMNQQLYRLLFATDGKIVRLGEATQRAKSTITDVDIRKTWALLGDPTMRWR